MAGTRLTRRDWLARLPMLLAETAARWSLTLGEPCVQGAAGYAVRATRSDGTPVVLKLVYPHRESEHEADALELWDGDGAVRLLARDDERHALLLERCEPGTFLSAWEGDRLGVLIGLLPRLWKGADGFRTLAEEAAWWAEYLPRECRDADLRDAALHYIGELAPTQGELVLAHQDLHGENVLAAAREPWLVIDPKPLAAERAFACAPIVRALELGDGRRGVLYRLDRLSLELGLDRERVRGWTVAQTVAWSGCRDYWPDAMESVRWLLAR